MAEHKVYQFYAELKDYEPKIYREFKINGEKTVAELVYAVMIMFEMQASHLFSLKQHAKEYYPEIRYESLNDQRGNTYGQDMLIEANKINLSQAVQDSEVAFTLIYDFGDNWEIDLKLKSVVKMEVSLLTLPQILSGQGFGIIEDVGGVRGLKQLAAVLKEKTGDEYRSYCEWLDSEAFDLEEFDIQDMNFRVRKLLRIYRNIYEYQEVPTDYSLKLLLRQYNGKGSRGY